MVRQTQVNRNGAGESPVRVVARTAAGLWHHILTLAELQTRLFIIELSEVLSRAGLAAGLVVAGGVIALTAIPVTLVALALTLVETLDMSPAGAFALIAALTLLVSAGLVIAGWWQLRKGVRLPRSQQEWRLNWNWLKTTLREESASANRPHPPVKR